MSDEALRELERQVAASPDDGLLRQQLLASYIRAGVCESIILGELAAIGDDAAILLLNSISGDDTVHPSLHPKSRRFYIACAFVAYRLAYSEWMSRYHNIRVTAGTAEAEDKPFAEMLSFLNSFTLTYLEGRSTQRTYCNGASRLYNERGVFEFQMSGTRAFGTVNSSMALTAIMLHRVLVSQRTQARAAATHCISEACYTLRRLNRGEGIETDVEDRGRFFEVIKPEISRILLPNYPPPTNYRHLGI